jgi:hypothetical protein
LEENIMAVDEETRLRLEDIDRRIAVTNTRFDATNTRFDDQAKRFDDMKVFVGGITSIFAVIFAVVTGYATWNFNNERADLRAFEEDIRRQTLGLGKTELEITDEKGSLLAGQVVSATLSEESTPYLPSGGELVFTIGLKNLGLVFTGPLFMKLYTGSGLPLVRASTDDQNYPYEFVLGPEIIHPNNLPGGISTNLEMHYPTADAKKIKAGSYPAQIKVYFGKGEVASARFTLSATTPAGPARDQ